MCTAVQQLALLVRGRFKQLEQGLEGARKELASKREASAAAHRRKDAAAAEEKRKQEEQSKAEALAARLKTEAEAAEMMRKCAEANIAQLSKQVAGGRGRGRVGLPLQ